MTRSWYEIRNAAADVAEIAIYDEIGMWGVSASDFLSALKGITAKAINLFINSPGGEVFDGISIYNQLKAHPAAVNVTVDGLAASSASFIAQAGDTITMAKSATMMIHEPYSMAVGNADDLRKAAEMTDKVGGTIAAIYAERAGGTEADWRAKMADETWYRAQEAVDAGLADGILAGKAPTNSAPRIFNLSKFQHVPKWLKNSSVVDAGKSMSGANLVHLHAAMGGLDSIHAGTCDMGADCPTSTTNHAAKILNENGTVCMVPECDEPWAINLPLCKDHAGQVMDESGDPPPPDEAAENKLPTMIDLGEIAAAIRGGVAKAREEAIV